MSFPNTTALTALTIDSTTLFPCSKASARNEISWSDLIAAQAALTSDFRTTGFAVRLAGGVAGTDEVQISYTGTTALIRNMKNGGTLTLQGTQQTISMTAGGTIAFTPNVSNGTSTTLSLATVAGIANQMSWTTSGTYIGFAKGVAVDGIVLGRTLVEANTAGSGSPNILTAAESRTLLTNEGVTAQNYHTLPTAAAGYDFEFVVQDSDGIRVVASAGDTIQDVGTVSAAAGYIQSTTVGSYLRLKSINATQWVVVGKTGTWTIDS